MTFPRHLSGKIKDTYVMVVLGVSTGAFLPLFVDSNNMTTTAAGSPILKAFWALVYAITVIRLILRWRLVATLLSANKVLLLLVSLALLSALWSLDPLQTLHGAGALAFSMLFAIDLSVGYSIRRQLKLACVVLVAVVLSSIVCQVFDPGAATGGEGLAWHGVFGRKNEFGRIVCLFVIACLTLVGHSKLKQTATIVSGAILVLLSRSINAVVYMAMTVMLVEMWSIMSWRPRARKIALFFVLSITAVMAVCVSQNFETLTMMMGRDPSMTGRVNLWRGAIAAAERKPLLGYGFGAFWGVKSQPAREVREGAGWEDAPHSHNAYIDLTLALGLVGLVVYLICCATLARRAYMWARLDDEYDRRWPLALLTLIILYQLTEGAVVTGNNIFWILFCSVTFSLASDTPQYSPVSISVTTPPKEWITTAISQMS